MKTANPSLPIPSRSRTLNTSVDAPLSAKERILIITLILLFIAFVLMLAVEAWQSRERELASAKRYLHSYVDQAKGHATMSVDKVDAILRLVQGRVKNIPLPDEELSIFLQKHLAAIPSATSLLMTDAEGNIIARAAKTHTCLVNISHRPYFKELMKKPSEALVISEPFFSEYEQGWIITLSRRWTASNGALAGAIVAVLPHTFFLRFYSQIVSGSEEFIAITDLNTRLLARYPEDPAKRGQILTGSTFERLLQEGMDEGVYIAPSHDDHVERVFAFSRVGTFNIAIIAGLATSTVLGEWKRKIIIFSAVTVSSGVLLFYFLAMLVRNYTKLRYQSKYNELYDEVTGLPKLKHFESIFESNTFAATKSGMYYPLMLVGIDGYNKMTITLGEKNINDVICILASRLDYGTGHPKLIGRIEEDKFILLLTEPQRLEDISKYTENLLETFSMPLSVGREEFIPSCTIGISLYPNDGKDLPTLLHNARVALVEGRSRNDRYHFFSSELNALIAHRWWMESALPKALRNNELTVYYQAQFSLSPRQLVGFEALLRWNHPEKGFISPAQFIPIAERTRMIVPIGAWVLQEACAQCQKWLEMGLFSGKMAVNLSAVQLQNADLLDLVTSTLQDTGLPPHHLELEITESAIMTDAENVLAQLDSLRARGVQISLDDFGTGYSNFSHLANLPVSKLKIDRSFIQDITNNATSRTVVECIISVGHKLGMTCLAEGVEHESQILHLTLKKCDAVQGFLTAIPQPAEVITPILQRHEW
ncbi:MAG: hypothetical protein BCS36_05550 [Desulfovibrio sp. MES5]|uniref:bifunctional diguanylate cyclase/phosphodiesterase n=1 Tax=Desulfovibrio sp. MES5 TaxID=1899016 RepID=UPI000B9CC1E6|nr:EAL domain-containing protein [Desulfovibrio sp. MES5]OXS30247.1 MAG: hypothetical protein BCS36_05550 [Desulfovibrio sp. MES5]